MTTSARRYAGIDSALTALPTAFDLEAVAGLYQRRWGTHSPGLEVVADGVHDVDYHPSSRCRVSHALTLNRPGHKPVKTFGVADVRSGGVRLRTLHEDPDLPWLADTDDPRHVQQYLRSKGIGSPNRIVRVVPIRYKMGSRCLLRLESEAGAVYLKVLASDVEHIARMAATFADVPCLLRPLGHSADRHMMVLPAVEGDLELHRLVFDLNVPDVDRLKWMRKAGAAIATLHAAPLKPGPARAIFDDAHELWANTAPIACAAPALLHPFNEAVRRLTSTSLSEGPPAASHGGFRTDQLMVAHGEPVIIDLDGLCWANPARDVGNFLASLRWKAIREPQHDAFIDAAVPAFLTGYASVLRLPDDRWLCRYEAGSMLRIAVRRFRKLNVGEWPLVPRLLEEAHDLLRQSERADFVPLPEPELPAVVRAAVDTRVVTAHLAPLLRNGNAHGDPPKVKSAELVAQKPDHRWTFQYEFHGDQHTVVGKVYQDAANGRRAHEIIRWLADHDLGVPRPLGWIEPLSMLASLHAPGRMLGDELFRKDAATNMEQTAAWLYGFHRSSLPLDRTFDVSNELGNLREWAGVVAEHYPDHGWAAERISSRLAERSSELGAVTNRPIHKDFHYQHVFVGERAHVIDLDEVRYGDPALDLAHFCAYLRLQGCRFPAMAATLDRRRYEFLAAYQRLAHDEVNGRYSVFYAYTCLKIAKQLCTSRGLAPRPQVEEEHRQTAEMLRQGLTALACG